jgi:hypothetical protein
LAWDQENLGSNPRSPTSFCGVAKWQGDWLLTSLCAGSNPAPTAKNAGVAFWSRAPLLQRGAVEFDPLPRYQMTARLWPRGFRHRSSKAIHAGSSPARRSMPRSFNGRTKVFGAFYVGSIPALGAKIVLAWCTVHRRTYKPLRSRSEHGLGSTPSASTMRSKLMRMSRRFLIVRQLVRFQPDAPSFGTVAEW